MVQILCQFKLFKIVHNLFVGVEIHLLVIRDMLNTASISTTLGLKHFYLSLGIFHTEINTSLTDG